MKKLLIILLLVFQFSTAAVKDSVTTASNFKKYLELNFEPFYCDACGCSANGGSMGFSSMLNYNFVGVRYMYQSYTTKQGFFNDAPLINENFNTIQIWSKIPITKKFQLNVLVPYHSNNRELSNGNETISGFGDATVMVMRTVFETAKNGVSINQKWQFGVGIKVPTGSYNTANKGTLNPSFQLGTGSWDYLLLSEYVIKKNQFGLNTALSYTFKSENKKKYQFGNQINYGATLFYFVNFNSIKFVPQLGLAGEVYAANKQVQQEVLETKGTILFSKFGFEIGLKKWSLGFNSLLPISQNLNNRNVKSNFRVSINTNYSL